MRAIQALAASAALLLLVAARAPAQQAPYTEGSVWNLTFIRVKPAMGDQYLNDLREQVRHRGGRKHSRQLGFAPRGNRVASRRARTESAV